MATKVGPTDQVFRFIFATVDEITSPMKKIKEATVGSWESMSKAVKTAVDTMRHPIISLKTMIEKAKFSESISGGEAVWKSITRKARESGRAIDAFTNKSMLGLLDRVAELRKEGLGVREMAMGVEEFGKMNDGRGVGNDLSSMGPQELAGSLNLLTSELDWSEMGTTLQDEIIDAIKRMRAGPFADEFDSLMAETGKRGGEVAGEKMTGAFGLMGKGLKKVLGKFFPFSLFMGKKVGAEMDVNVNEGRGGGKGKSGGGGGGGGGIGSAIGGAVFGPIGSFLGSFVDKVLGAFQPLLAVASPIRILMEALQPVVALLQNILVPLMVPITDAFGQLAQAIRPLVVKFVPMLVDLFSGLTGSIGDVEGFFGPLMQLVKDVFKPLGQILSVIMDPLIKLAKVYLVEVFKNIQLLVIPAFEVLAELFDMLFPPLMAALTPIIKVIMQLQRILYKILIPVFRLLFVVLSAVLGPILMVIAEAFEAIGEVLDGIEAAMAPVIKAFNKFIDSIVASFHSMMNSLMDMPVIGWALRKLGATKGSMDATLNPDKDKKKEEKIGTVPGASQEYKDFLNNSGSVPSGELRGIEFPSAVAAMRSASAGKGLSGGVESPLSPMVTALKDLKSDSEEAAKPIVEAIALAATKIVEKLVELQDVVTKEEGGDIDLVSLVRM